LSCFFLSSRFVSLLLSFTVSSASDTYALSLHDALPIYGTSGSAVLSKEETRTFCSGSSEGSLLSRMYTINSNEYQEVSAQAVNRSEEHTSELQSRFDLVCRLLLEKNKRRKASSPRRIGG